MYLRYFLCKCLVFEINIIFAYIKKIFEFSCYSKSVANLARLISVMFIATERRDIKPFKEFKLNFVVIIVYELVQFENQAKFG